MASNSGDHDVYVNWCNVIIDKTLNLNTPLIQVTPKWYQFGLAVGINKETLNEFSNFTPEECIVEVSDLWLRTSVTTLTWRDVADALNESLTGCYRLAEKILKVYKTGEAIHAAHDQSSIIVWAEIYCSDTDSPPFLDLIRSLLYCEHLPARCPLHYTYALYYGA